MLAIQSGHAAPTAERPRAVRRVNEPIPAAPPGALYWRPTASRREVPMAADYHGLSLSRRHFVQGAGAAGLGLLAGCGPLPFQQPPPTAVKIYHLGFLSGDSPSASAQRLEVFRQTLGQLG